MERKHGRGITVESFGDVEEGEKGDRCHGLGAIRRDHMAEPSLDFDTGSCFWGTVEVVTIHSSSVNKHRQCLATAREGRVRKIRDFGLGA